MMQAETRGQVPHRRVRSIPMRLFFGLEPGSATILEAWLAAGGVMEEVLRASVLCAGLIHCDPHTIVTRRASLDGTQQGVQTRPCGPAGSAWPSCLRGSRRLNTMTCPSLRRCPSTIHGGHARYLAASCQGDLRFARRSERRYPRTDLSGTRGAERTCRGPWLWFEARCLEGVLPLVGRMSPDVARSTLVA